MIVFPETYKTAATLVQPDTKIFVRGKVNTRDDIPKVIAEEIIAIDDVQAKFTKSICIDLNTAGLDPTVLQEIKGRFIRNSANGVVHSLHLTARNLILYQHQLRGLNTFRRTQHRVWA